MIKKLFYWTPRDIAYWEKIHQNGLLKFIGWYGVVVSGGLLFLVFGAVTTVIWLRQTSGILMTRMSLIFLLGQLVVVMLVCLVGGIINGLVTWWVEDRLYKKYKAGVLTPGDGE